MRRRDLLVLTGGAIIVAHAAVAQTANRRIAFIHPTLPIELISETNPYWKIFFAELRRLGDVEGQNLTVDRYSAEGHPERYAEVARLAVSHNPDLIVTFPDTLASEALKATQTIPIVAIMGDPLRTGLVTSLARPNVNLTGTTVNAGIELYGKRLQILKEAVPSVSRVGYLSLSAGWEGQSGKYLREASSRLGISLIPLFVDQITPAALDRVLAALPEEHLDGVYVTDSPELGRQLSLIVASIEKARLPASYPYRFWVEKGGLMSYGPDIAGVLRRIAEDVHLILNGAKPGDIPIYQPAKFELIINLQTAKAIGLTMPASLLAQADEVIE